MGGRLGSTLGQLAAFMEESQLKACNTELVDQLELMTLVGR